MKILMLTATVPFPPMDGYSLRCISIARELARHHEVHLLAVNPAGGSPDLAHRLNIFHSVHVVPVPHHPIVTAMKALYRREPYHVVRYTNTNLEQKLRELLTTGQFNMVYSNFMYFSGVLASATRESRPLLVLDQHNLDRDMWRQKASMEGSVLRRVASRLNLAATKAYEERFYPLYDMVVSVSERDKQGSLTISQHPEVIVAPNGVDTSRFREAPLPHQRPGSTILFVGSNVPMNIQAIEWFCKEIFPLVRKRVPNAEFHIVGNIQERAVAHSLEVPGVKFWGRVSDVTPHFTGARVFVAPFRVGSGSKLKVLEAFAARCPLVATGAGIVGIGGAIPGRHYEHADDADQFADKCIRLLTDDGLANVVADNARTLAEMVYDWGRIGETIEGSVHAIMAPAQEALRGRGTEL